ncbi:MAG: ABC transporter ATP-binding protein [Lentisphaeria bacterium]|nr:ABC transporter ATP-binding protein [Lentisphaeria bacterium]
MEIKVQNMTRRFGFVTAVDNVSFSFGSGDIFGFIGPNGAGKTTTIRVMTTLDLPSEGDVFYDGISAVLYPEEARRIVGYMPDSLPDYKDVAVWEYLDFCARGFGLKGALRKRRLAEVEEFTELGEMREKFLCSLSKGMKQRVSLARALIHDPQVLIMDEPAAGLDPRARLELRNLLKILAGQKKAILLSSHILSELQDICNGAVIIEKGKVLSAGSIQEMTKTVEAEAAREEKKGEVIIIECPSQLEALKLKLLEHPAVSDVCEYADGKLHFTLADEEKNLTPLMAQLFNAGLPIKGFSREQMSLEELFMRVTEGKVQ